jgi:hypothetical protein
MNESRYAASPSDGREILRILESSAAQGSIELYYTRRPDAYASYMQEPGEARVFVSKDGGRTVGTCAEIISEVYIGGEIRKAAYICGLKKDADYEGGVGFGVHLLRDFCREDIDFYYCSVVADNADAMHMFEKSRRIISMTPMADYRTYIVSPRARIKAPRHPYTFRRAAEEDLPSLLDFLREEGRKKDLFPVIPSPDPFHGLRVRDFCLLLDGDRIIATAALWNRTSCKQYVVKQYRGLMKLARGVNPLLWALRYVRLPKENIPLDFPMLSFALAEQDREDTYRILVNELRKEIARSYGIYVIGLPTAHPAAKLFDRLPSIHFDTKLYEIRLPWGKSDGAAVDPRRLQPECGLL